MSARRTHVAKQGSKGVMMILSPAKTLDVSPYQSKLPTTIPDCHTAQTQQIVKAMKARNEKELTKLLGISANLGKTASGYWQNFREDFKADTTHSKPCIYAFTGVAYQGLQIHTCSDETVLYLQDNLRIIDPLYGVLRPLDLIQPYRLEMATKNVLPEQKTKLQDFWKAAVTASLQNDLKDRPHKVVLNIASDEYSSAVDESNLPSGTAFVKVVFHDGGRTVAVHAKRARGLMAKFVAQHQCQTLDDVQKFDSEGYVFAPDKSDDLSLVFERRTPAEAKRKSAPAQASSKTKKKRAVDQATTNTTTPDHKFWERLVDQDDNATTTATGRCGFSWHMAVSLSLVALIYHCGLVGTAAAPEDDASYEVTTQIVSVLATGSSMLVSLFLAAPMVYFVINSFIVEAA